MQPKIIQVETYHTDDDTNNAIEHKAHAEPRVIELVEYEHRIVEDVLAVDKTITGRYFFKNFYNLLFLLYSKIKNQVWSNNLLSLHLFKI